MTTFIKRTISAVVFVAVVLGAALFGPWAFALVFAAITAICLMEFYHMVNKSGAQVLMAWAVPVGVAMFAWAALRSMQLLPGGTAYAVIPAMGLTFVMELFRAKEQPLHNIGLTLLGWLYVVAPMALLCFMVNTPDGYTHKYLISTLLLVWSNDTGAYLLGMAVGRHKMFPRISPKKSWEGFAGGLATTALVAVALWRIFGGELPQWLMLGAVVGVFGVLGDLVESMFKRAVGVKDSGSLMPGHGGLLDRFDALLLAAPMAFVYLKLMSII